MSKELTLLQTIYNEIKALKKKIEDVDEKLLVIKALLLKEEEVSEEEKEEIKRILDEPEENFVTLEELKMKFKI